MHSALLLAIAALPFLGADALKCSTTARCGTQSKNTLTCKGSAFGNCCSISGHCGSSLAYCGKGCQAGFGDCKSSNSPPVKSSSASAKTFSTSIKSSTSSAKVIVVSVTPTAASSIPYSTFTPLISSPISVSPPSSSTTSSAAPLTPSSSSTESSAAPLTPSSSSTASSSAPAASSSIPDVKISTDGTCGGTQGFTCPGSLCCSEYGWCGSTSIYCDAGCNAAFGTCNVVSASVQPSSTSSPASFSSALVPSFTTSTVTATASPSPTQAVSTDGQCGASNGGLTCMGSQFGDCCSQYGYCGSASAFCGTSCQSGFGKCDTVPAPGNTCGVKGFANKAEYYASSFNLIDTTDVSTCAALCLAEATCKSYLFNPGLQNCAYLQYSLVQGEFIATTSTNQLFWDRACAEATPS